MSLDQTMTAPRKTARRLATLGLGLAVSALAACGGSPAGPSSSSTARIALNGAGATFPYPIYSQWAHAYSREKGIQINYQSIGSGGGVAQIKAKTVDFGASDAPLPGDELDSEGLVQFPMVIGGVVPVVHLEGVAPGSLKLTPALLADIYLGAIARWNDPRLQELNPGVALPDKEITVVRRSDGSGTTWIFTTYLSEVSAAWKEKVGAGKAVEWPAGVGGKGNEGVANYVERIDGAIGYVEYAYAIQNRMNVAQLQNRDGNFVEPGIVSFQAAAANADWQSVPGFGVVLVNQPGPQSWPISGATFILMHRDQADPAKASAILDFFRWCYENGAESAKALHYVPLPPVVHQQVTASWSAITSGGKPVAPAAAPGTAGA